ncbi:MAG: hypothetical protein Q8P67_14800, partial [archaeon]|nr:hypothetical protein [archaeon]
MATPVFELALCLVRQHIGPHAAQVYRELMAKKMSDIGLGIGTLVSLTKLPVDAVQEALLRLIVKSAVYAVRPSSPTTPSSSSSSSSSAEGSKRVLYFADPQAVLQWIRYPRFVSLANAAYGPDAMAVLLELGGTGALTRADLVSQTLKRPLATDYQLTQGGSSRDFSAFPDRDSRVNGALELLIMKGFIVPLAIYHSSSSSSSSSSS